METSSRLRGTRGPWEQFSASGQVSGLAGRPTPGVIFASAKAAAGKAWACRSEPGLVGPWTGSKLGKQAVCLETGLHVITEIVHQANTNVCV